MIELFDDDFGLSKNELLRKLSSQLNGNCCDGEIKVRRNDREYLMFSYLGVSQGCRVSVPPYFEIKSIIPYLHSQLVIRKSHLIDWVAEHLLSIPDYQTGDADFDASFYIKVKNNDWGSKFFHTDSIKLGISNLLKNDFDLICTEDEYLRVVKYGDSFPKVETINHAIEQMEKIISDFPCNQ